MTENATERRAALCMLLIAHTVYNAYSERTVAHEYGIDMNNVLQQPHKQQALRDETAPRKHRNLGESRANDDIIYGWLIFKNS
ncbi:unnamed protein product [Toxocara canis]|uniref:Transposase n=1 Tax=Toxocara canis TaxID=6265 RepID=A0A183UR83_TOXCA|nr:unnamed protein product [Toxocara canis]